MNNIDFDDYNPNPKEIEKNLVTGTNENSIKNSFFNIFTMNFWRKFFDFEENEITSRLKSSIFMQDIGS